MTKQKHTARLLYNYTPTLFHSHSQPPCPLHRISPSLPTTTTRRRLPVVVGTSRNTFNSHRIHALAHHLPLGGSVLWSSCSSFPCSGCTSLFARQCRGGQSHRSRMLRGVSTMKLLSFFRLLVDGAYFLRQRYSKQHKYRPAASPVVYEKLKDGRMRVRGAPPSYRSL